MNIAKYLHAVKKYNASDLLITADSPPVFRVDGELCQADEPALTAAQTRELLYALLNEHQVSRFEEAKELDFAYSLDQEHRFRVNYYFQRGCVAGAFRFINNKIPALAELGLPPVMAEIAMKNKGLILITGPTGHGKSTTQAALIDYINVHRKTHIITIEDPIEFIHQHKKSVVDQREIGRDSHSFSIALKHVLRQDPDVILVGEMRDLETIATCLTAAETGHLVISTLHTNDAVQTIDRLVDVFPPNQQRQVRLQFSMTLLAILAQRLIPQAQESGRILATELLINTSATANLIREGRSHQIRTVLESQSKVGMHTFDSSLRNLYSQGLISYEAAAALVSDPRLLEHL